MKVKDQRVMAMADTGATHTFVDVKIVAKLGIKLTRSPYKRWRMMEAEAMAREGLMTVISWPPTCTMSLPSLVKSKTALLGTTGLFLFAVHTAVLLGIPTM
ncbi:hypothetical protein H5410_055311 [Solanum commersonii]|uniref:Uncharacterized protein n=1 Tax=Solanum commersonii TaxID=4109 RepID=A0A9J5WH88_SOLCO|nr:hypothetical protein H5410_055311 [Solanum commersonii]